MPKSVQRWVTIPSRGTGHRSPQGGDRPGAATCGSTAISAGTASSGAGSWTHHQVRYTRLRRAAVLPGRGVCGILDLSVLAQHQSCDRAREKPSRRASRPDRNPLHSSYPCFYPFGYTIDIVIPIISVHQADNWGLDGKQPVGRSICGRYLDMDWTRVGAGDPLDRRLHRTRTPELTHLNAGAGDRQRGPLLDTGEVAPAVRDLYPDGAGLLPERVPAQRCAPGGLLRRRRFLSSRVRNYQYNPVWGALINQFWIR